MRNKEGSTRGFGGDGGGCGFGSAVGVARGFAGHLFLLRFFFPDDLFLRDLFSVVLVDDPGHVGAGFAKWRHSPILLDALRTCVVSGQRLDEIEIVALEKFAKVAASALNIGLWIEGIVHAKLVGGAGHQLHESAGAFGGNGVRVESAFGVNDAVHEVGVEMIGGAGGVHDLIQSGRGTKFRRLRFRRRGGGRGLRICGCRQREIFFVAGDLFGGPVGEAGIVGSEKKASRRSHHQAMLVANAEAVAENCQLGGSRGTSEQSYGYGTEKRGGFRRNSRSPLRRRWPSLNHHRLLTIVGPTIAGPPLWSTTRSEE